MLWIKMARIFIACRKEIIWYGSISPHHKLHGLTTMALISRASTFLTSYIPTKWLNGTRYYSKTHVKSMLKGLKSHQESLSLLDGPQQGTSQRMDSFIG
jgi:hypothetical protein